MSGIAGYLTTDPSYAVPAELVGAMVDALTHRGPDGRAVVRDGNVAFGVRQLGATEPAGGGQPVANEDGSVAAVLDGAIFNQAALRRDLRALGRPFRTAADAEVLVRGFEQWGLDGLLPRLDGAFAFCLYDRR